MTKALKKIQNIGIVFKDLSKIKQGETSDTFVGDYNNKKVILKVYKESKLKNKQNDLLNENLIRQLSDLKLFPKIITALSSDTYDKVYQCTHNSSRYKHLIEEYTITDIEDSTFI